MPTFLEGRLVRALGGLALLPLLVATASAQLVLLDQPLTEAPLARGGLISTVATGGASATQIAAGFTMDGTESVSSLEWWGGHDSPSTVPDTAVLELRLFDDLNGLPTTAADETIVLDFSYEETGLVTGNGDAILHYTASLDPPLELFSGAQWISIVERDITPGDWLWMSADELPVLIADRFGSDTTAWTDGLAFRGNRSLRLLPEPALASAAAAGTCLIALFGRSAARTRNRRLRWSATRSASASLDPDHDGEEEMTERRPGSAANCAKE